MKGANRGANARSPLPDITCAACVVRIRRDRNVLGPGSGRAVSDRPIRLVVGFGAGGPTDILARALAEQLSDSLGRKVIVENRTGASGNIATQAVATAEADGNTLLIGASPLAVNHSLFPDFPVKYGRDLMAVAPLGATANVLVVHPSLNVRDARAIHPVRARAPGRRQLRDARHGVLVASRRRRVRPACRHHDGPGQLPGRSAKPPGTCSAGTCRLGSPPFRRCSNWSAPGSLWRSRPRARARAWLPDVPTMSELGLSGFDVRLWVGLFAPAKVPAERIRRSRPRSRALCRRPAIKSTLNAQGIAPLPIEPHRIR